VALDPKSRDILAVVGGYGGKPGDFERATQGLRQAGSTFKPLVYAAALASGRHTAADMVQDLPRMYADGWSPRNFSGTYQGPLRLRAALAHSVNTVAVQVLYDTGIARVVALAGRLGLPPAQLPRDLTLALGTALVSPLQLAGAYATFADTLGGRYLPPRLFDEDPTLPPLDPGSDGGNEALPAGLSYLMTSLLGSVVSEGSAVRARELGIPGLAGKTGTTSAGHDAWFVGYHPGLLAVVWVGDDDGPVAPAGGDDHAGDRTGAETALPLWLDFMRAAQEHGQAAVAPNAPPLPSKDPWPRPPGLGEVKLPEGGTELLLPHTP
jgi:penicillin-binding protein 1A